MNGRCRSMLSQFLTAYKLWFLESTGNTLTIAVKIILMRCEIIPWMTKRKLFLSSRATGNRSYEFEIWGKCLIRLMWKRATRYRTSFAFDMTKPLCQVIHVVGYIPSNSTYLSALFPKLEGRLKHPFDFILLIIDRIVSLSLVVAALYVVFNIPQGKWAFSALTAQGLQTPIQFRVQEGMFKFFQHFV